ncbi:hypothetical protein J2S10_003227 [Neobacillus ginsengisoli]|uniref:YfhE family protein n=1 Tax=Neobacillus ginsengisoli TaxID=904295 RepID=A0ABT9XWU5_9BACI|nr:hypothetical protein [Neobacillus ginsengisoli]
MTRKRLKSRAVNEESNSIIFTFEQAYKVKRKGKLR